MVEGTPDAEEGVPHDPDDLLDHVTDAVYALDGDWKFTYLNERAIERLPYDEDELLGTSVWDAFPEAMETEFHDAFVEARESGEPVTHEGYYAPHDYWVEVRVFPAEAGVTVFSRDVTERKRTEKELQAAVRYLQALYDVAADPEREFAEKLPEVLDVGREYLDVDTGFLARIDREAAVQEIVEARGSHDLLQPGESCPLSEAYCRKTIDTDGGLLAIHDAVEAGWEGDPAYDVFELGTYIGGRVLVDGDLFGTLCFADRETRDRAFSDSERVFVELLTEWVSHELARERLLEDVQERNRSLEQFASILSHDLRNPLNVANGRIDILREEMDNEHLDRAADALDRMEDLIEDVLVLTGHDDEIEEAELVGLEAAAREAWESVEAPDATLAVEDPGTVSGDRSGILRLFENLFRNAVEHAAPDVTVEVGPTAEGFYVADDGPGIPEEERETVFEYGHTTDDSGTGLGLAIVERVAEIHGWDVRVTESESGGARFEFAGVDTDAGL